MKCKSYYVFCITFYIVVAFLWGIAGGIEMKNEKTLLITEDVIEDCLSECLEK